MIYTKDWCVLHLPRTSGTNFKVNAVMQYGGKVSLPYTEPTVVSRLSQHNTFSFFSELLEEQPVFAFVRHPYTRALSLYNYAINDSAFRSIVGLVSFEDFWEVDLSSYCNWSLKTNQVDFIENFDRVTPIKLETESLSLYRLTKVLQIKKTVNSSQNDYYKCQFNNKKNKALIEDMFKKDYEYFGYK